MKEKFLYRPWGDMRVVWAPSVNLVFISVEREWLIEYVKEELGLDYDC